MTAVPQWFVITSLVIGAVIAFFLIQRASQTRKPQDAMFAFDQLAALFG